MDFYNLREKDQEIFDRCSLRYKLVWSDVEIIKFYQTRIKICRFYGSLFFEIYEGNFYEAVHIDKMREFSTLSSHTALHYAVIQGNVEMARILIKAGADVNKSSTLGSSLNIALSKNRKEICKLLVYAGAYIDIDSYHKLRKMFESTKQEERREKIMRLIES